jgi:2-dehydropantoate 2-reductase
LHDAFARAAVAVEVPSSIVRAVWHKFLMATSFGGVGAIARAPIGVTRSVPETRRLLEQCLEEVVAVARARSIAMPTTAIADIMKLFDGLPPGSTTSLQRDIADGKPSELEYWNGAVVRLGREAQVLTPTHAHIYGCLLPQELHARGKIAFPG